MVPLTTTMMKVIDSVFLDPSGDTFHVEFVWSTISSVGQPQWVEDANLGKR